MKFYGKPQECHYRLNTEVLDVIRRLLVSKEKVFNVVETALREAGHDIYRAFNDFGLPEIEAAIAEARKVKSSVTLLDGSAYADAAAEQKAWNEAEAKKKAQTATQESHTTGSAKPS